MTRCLICHDPLGNEDGPTCGAKICATAYRLIKWAANEDDIIQVVNKRYFYCVLCRKISKKPFDTRIQHKAFCPYETAKEILGYE